MQRPARFSWLLLGCLAGAALLVDVSPASSRVLEFTQILEGSRLDGPYSLAMSPDGRQVYVVTYDGVSVFRRNAADGALGFVYREEAQTLGFYGVVASPDGRHVYGVSGGYRTADLSTFERDPVSGRLTWIERSADHRLVSLSPDGRHVYAAIGHWEYGRGLAVLARDPGTGILTRVETYDDDSTGVSGLNDMQASAVSPDGTSVYVILSGGAALATFRRDVVSGRLSLEGVPMDVRDIGGSPTVTFGPAGRTVYVGGEVALGIYRRDPSSGELSLVERHAYGADRDDLVEAAGVTVSPDGRNVYVPFRGRDGFGTNRVSAAVAVFARDPSRGTVRFLESHHDGVDGIEGLRGAAAVVVSPDGRDLYVGGSTLVRFARDAATGALRFVDSRSNRTEAVHGLDQVSVLAVSPQGGTVFAASWSGSLVAFRQDRSTGALTLLDALYQTDGEEAVVGLRGANAVAVSPDGHNLYVASPGALLSVFTWDEAQRALEPLEVLGFDGSLYAACSVVVSPDGRNVYAASPDAVAVYSRNEITGEVGLVETHAVVSWCGSLGLAMSPDGNNVYLTSGYHYGAVWVFSRDATTGRLHLSDQYFADVNGVEELFAARAVAVSPDGRNLYVGSWGHVVVFARDVVSGAVRLVEAHENPGSQVISLAVSPDGSHLYSTSDYGDSLAVFARDSATGRLELVEYLVDQAGGVDGLFGARSVAVSLDGRYAYAAGWRDDAIAVFRRSEARCLRNPHALCLDGNRFRVELEWRDHGGRTGSARPVPSTSDDSGLMWFSDEADWEMLVKVLDGCALNDRYWVLAAGATDLEYVLRVTDTLTGVVRTYQNPLGRAAPAIVDVEAFATCGGGPVAAGGIPPAAGSPLSVTESEVEDPMRSECWVRCLDYQYRFRVDVEWRDHSGDTGTGRAMPYRSEDSGLFWFFGPDNWELLVKVLDGCALNDRYWVFAAAATDVEYTLRVTDLWRGHVREYFNPLGNAAPALADTAAFACSW